MKLRPMVAARERAFEALVGADYEYAAKHGFPDTVILPSNVHEQARRAAQLTARDGRERAVLFGFLGGRWLGGAMLKGAASFVTPEGGEAIQPSVLHSLAAAIVAPHLEMHTHPLLSESGIEAKVLDELQPAVEQSLYSFPSTNDVLFMMARGGVAHLISTTRGSFLSVRKDPTLPTRLPYPMTNGKDIALADEVVKQVRKDVYVKNYDKSSAEAIREHAALHIAEALKPVCTAYFNPALSESPVFAAVLPDGKR